MHHHVLLELIFWSLFITLKTLVGIFDTGTEPIVNFLLTIVDYGECLVGSSRGLFAVSEYCPDGDYRDLLTSYAEKRPDCRSRAPACLAYSRASAGSSLGIVGVKSPYRSLLKTWPLTPACQPGRPISQLELSPRSKAE